MSGFVGCRPNTGAKMSAIRLSCLAGMVGLLAGFPGWSLAQSAPPLELRASTGSVGDVRDAARVPARKQTSKRKDAPRAGAATSGAVGYSVPQPWTIEHALPGKPSTQSRSVPTVSNPGLGRVPFESGSFGLSTSSTFKDNEFGDGRRVPGLETTKREAPSYFGLSLSVPTNDPGFLPLLRRRE